MNTRKSIYGRRQGRPLSKERRDALDVGLTKYQIPAPLLTGEGLGVRSTADQFLKAAAAGASLTAFGGVLSACGSAAPATEAPRSLRTG